jgi:cation:H+ antiporter
LPALNHSCAARLAVAIGISPLIVGLTVVTFCTFNILFILGLSAMVAPLVVKMQLIRIDVPIALLASVLVFALGLTRSF